MALIDYLVPTNSRANICFDCQKACGGCSWSEIDPSTKKPRFEPVPGWTAEPIRMQIGNNQYGKVMTDTYRITACPEFVADEPRQVEKRKQGVRW